MTHTKFNYSKINNHIFVGTNFCCTAHFNDELIKMGINADVSLEEENIDNPKVSNIFFGFQQKIMMLLRYNNCC